MGGTGNHCKIQIRDLYTHCLLTSQNQNYHTRAPVASAKNTLILQKKCSAANPQFNMNISSNQIFQSRNEINYLQYFVYEDTRQKIQHSLIT